MEDFVNIAVDIETLSKRPTAAIISIAARVFTLDGGPITSDIVFRQSVDATSCAMYGFDIDPATVDWWSRQDDELKEQFKENVSIKSALENFAVYIDDALNMNNAVNAHIWCQGTDFDISILRNAYVVVNKDREEKNIPWNYSDVRDSRTFIQEGVKLLAPELEDPYSFIPKDEGWVKHDAMSDVNRLIKNVQYVYRQLQNRLNQQKDV